MRIVLTPSIFARGTVRFTSGAPAAGARVCAFLTNLCDLNEEVVADAEGRFETGPLPSGEVIRIVAVMAGYSAVMITRKFDRDADNVLLALGEGGTLQGTVCDETGRPVAGAEVIVNRSGEPTRYADEGDVLWSQYTQKRALTDGAGSYQMRGLLAPAAYVVCVREGRRLRGCSDAFVLEATSAPRRLDIAFPWPAHLHVLACDANGLPLPFAQLELRGEGSFERERADGAGTWNSPPLMPGTYAIRMEPGDGTMASASGVYLDSGRTEMVKLIATRPSKRVLPAARVVGRLRGGGSFVVSLESLQGMQSHVVSSSEGGTFEFAVPAECPLDVYLGEVALLQELQLTQGSELNLGAVERTPPFTLRGEVRLPGGERAKSGFVCVSKPWVLCEGSGPHASIRPDGTWVMEGCRAGRLSIHASVPGQGWKEAFVEARPDTAPLIIEIPEHAVLTGRVVDRKGIPVNGCWGFARPEGSPRSESREIVPGPLGLFRTLLMPGDWILEWPGFEEAVHLVGGQTTHLEIRPP